MWEKLALPPTLFCRKQPELGPLYQNAKTRTHLKTRRPVGAVERGLGFSHMKYKRASLNAVPDWYALVTALLKKVDVLGAAVCPACAL